MIRSREKFHRFEPTPPAFWEWRQSLAQEEESGLSLGCWNTLAEQSPKNQPRLRVTSARTNKAITIWKKAAPSISSMTSRTRALREGRKLW
jgi:hypothetical protein